MVILSLSCPYGQRLTQAQRIRSSWSLSRWVLAWQVWQGWQGSKAAQPNGQAPIEGAEVTGSGGLGEFRETQEAGNVTHPSPWSQSKQVATHLFQTEPSIRLIKEKRELLKQAACEIRKAHQS